jgi:riboflavin synthase
LFTGIIEEVGRVRKINRGNQSIRLSITCEKVLKDIGKGDSIAVNGICLTVTDFESGWFTVDVMPETMRKTELSKLNINSGVNLERALRLSDRLGGHIVSGHIDGTGIIIQKTEEDNAHWLFIEAAPDILRYIVVKGSVAIDGISLTAASVDNTCFGVSIIPHTYENTNIALKKEGDTVNIECDFIGKYVEKLMGYNRNNTGDKGITIDFLETNGFM